MERKDYRIIIADDHALFRTGIIDMLDSEKDLHIVGEAVDGFDLIKKHKVLKPDLLLVDISMPNKSGIDTVSEIRENDDAIKILFLSMYKGQDYIYHCIRAGGNGLVNKNILKGDLIYAINTIISGNNYFGPEYKLKDVEEIVSKFDKYKEVPDEINITKISNKEREILYYMSDGLSSENIAEKMNVSRRTIDTHRSNLMQKFRLGSLTELIKFAINYSIANKKPKQ